MSSQDPMEKFAQEVEKLFQFMEKQRSKNSTSPEVPEGTEAILSLIEQYAQAISNASEETIRNAGADQEQLQKLINNPKDADINKAERQILTRLNRLKQETDSAIQEIAVASEAAKAQEILIGKKGKAAKARKKKFKPLGGKKDWKPM